MVRFGSWREIPLTGTDSSVKCALLKQLMFLCKLIESQTF
jgi:hypothetical protein